MMKHIAALSFCIPRYIEEIIMNEYIINSMTLCVLIGFSIIYSITLHLYSGCNTSKS